MKRKAPTRTSTVMNVLLFFVVPTLLIVGVVVGHYLTRSIGIQQTLTGFYKALYEQADLSAAAEYLTEERREDFVTALTMGGANAEFYLDYNARAVELYGEDINIKVTVVSVQDASGGNNYSGSSDYCKAIFTIIMSGSLGKEQYKNSLEFVKRDGVWYMTDYIPLPVGYNLRVE
jgi:hypothetical protein